MTVSGRIMQPLKQVSLLVAYIFLAFLALQDGSDAGSQGRRGGVDDHNSIYDAETEPSAEVDEAETLVAMQDTLGQQTQRHTAGTLLPANATAGPSSVPADQGL